MPNRVTWEPGFAVGHELLDGQHREGLALCNRLADLCEAPGDEGQFDAVFAALKSLALAHFEAEDALLAARGYAGLDEHREANDEFGYLADEIATTENFDRLELQRFVALWWVGHIAGTAGVLRALFAGGDAAA